MVAYPNSKASGGYVLSHLIGKRTQYKFKEERDDPNLWTTEKHLWDEGLYTFYEHDFLKEMEARGFDIKTLKFSIKLDASKLKARFPHIYEGLTQAQKDKLCIP